jgi:uncharacterized membrane protein YheB (UPF0754 family)
MDKLITYISLPLIAALIGWFTNWIAIKMLFYPRKPVRFIFFDIQGIFPKRQALVAERIGKMVADELFSLKDIKEKLNQPGNMEGINESIETKINEYLNTTFPANHPIMSMFMGRKARTKIKDDFMVEIAEITPMVVNQYMDNLEADLDIEKIIKDRVALLSPETLEQLLNSILKTEFRFIELIGAVLGFIIGVIQVGIVVLQDSL